MHQSSEYGTREYDKNKVIHALVIFSYFFFSPLTFRHLSNLSQLTSNISFQTRRGFHFNFLPAGVPGGFWLTAHS